MVLKEEWGREEASDLYYHNQTKIFKTSLSAKQSNEEDLKTTCALGSELDCLKNTMPFRAHDVFPNRYYDYLLFHNRDLKRLRIVKSPNV